MNITVLEKAACTIKMCGQRQADGTINLGMGGDGDNIQDWPDTITLVSGTVMRLTNVPNPVSTSGVHLETAWYEL